MELDPMNFVIGFSLFIAILLVIHGIGVFVDWAGKKVQRNYECRQKGKKR